MYKQQLQGFCPRCGITVTVGQRLGATITCAGLGVMFGKQAMRDPLAQLLCFAAGLAIGNIIDRKLEKVCPQCGGALQILGLLP